MSNFLYKFNNIDAEISKEEFRKLFILGRSELGLPDNKLAQELGVANTTISRWINGVTCAAPSARKIFLRKIARRIKKT